MCFVDSGRKEGREKKRESKGGREGKDGWMEIGKRRGRTPGSRRVGGVLSGCSEPGHCVVGGGVTFGIKHGELYKPGK